MSFGKAEISLTNCGYTLVSGINQSFEDMAKSNGSGKSSIWEAVSWVLTGETIRGTKDVVNKFAEGGSTEVPDEINETLLGSTPMSRYDFSKDRLAADMKQYQ